MLERLKYITAVVLYGTIGLFLRQISLPSEAAALPMLYKVLGKKRLYPIIAKFEYGAADTYRPAAEKYPEIEEVKNDEHRHGDMVKSLLH